MIPTLVARYKEALDGVIEGDLCGFLQNTGVDGDPMTCNCSFHSITRLLREPETGGVDATHPLSEELRELGADLAPSPNPYRPTDCDNHVDWDDEVRPRNEALRRAADALDATSIDQAVYKDAFTEEQRLRSEAEAERDELRRQLVALRGSQDTAWLAEVARREEAQKRLAETLVLHGVAEAQAARYREVLDTAIELWARETTGLGGKLDRFACLERFREQAQALRDPETGKP